MTWHASDPMDQPQAGDLLASAHFPNGFNVDVVVVLNSLSPLTVLLRITRGGQIPEERRIARSLLISSPGGYFQTPPIPQIMVSSGETLELVSRDILTEEVQGTLFTRACG